MTFTNTHTHTRLSAYFLPDWRF